jgi:N-carbamoylputrescine amidase
MQSRGPFQVALVQMGMSADPAANLDAACAKVHEAAGRGAKVICLPELFRSQYFCQKEDPSLFDLAESIPGPSTEALGWAARLDGVVIVASLFERRAPGLYHNTTAVIGTDGTILGVYRKMHIPDDPNYYEKFYFTPGDLGFRIVPTEFGNIGVLICWDQWYPEAARLTALHGADIIFYPTAIGWHPAEKETHGGAQQDAWRTVQRGHAIANGVYVAAVNRVGIETPAGPPGLEFWGGSFLADPQGIVLAEGAANREEILYGTVDPARIEDVRRNWPFLRDRRIDAYKGLDRRFLDNDLP